MDSFRADFRAVDKLDIARQSIPLGVSPARRNLGPTEKAALKAAAEFAKLFTPSANLPLEVIGISERRPAVTLLAPKTVPVGLKPGSSHHLTVALGLSFELFGLPVGIIPTGAAVQPGFYGSSTPELGVFISGALGVFLNLGISVGPCLTFIFGPPSDLAGVAVGIAADISIPGISIAGAGASGGAMLLFSPSPFRFLGFAFTFGVGVSALPVTVSLQVSSTAVKPLLKP